MRHTSKGKEGERGKGPTSKGDRKDDREGMEREGKGIPTQSKVSRINTG